MSGILAALSLLALAQDLGTGWMDRVGHRLREADRPPLTARPASLTLSAGELYTHDSNVYFDKKDETSDSIFTTFGRVQVEYAEAHFDAEADVLVNYDYFVEEEDARDHEERLYGRARYAASRWALEVAQILRRESDPIDAVFADRAERVISDTVPRLSVELAPGTTVDLTAQVESVTFRQSAFENGNNLNTRVTLSGAAGTPIGYSLVMDAGYVGIRYLESGAPPDTQGFFARLGGRGEFSRRLAYDARAGVTRVSSDEFSGTTERATLTTSDILVQLRYTPTETVTVQGDYTRQIGFSASNEPFQVIDRATLLGDWAATELLSLRARVQYDRVHGALGSKRDFTSASAGGAYRFLANVLADASVTWRFGREDTGSGITDFVGVLVSVGVILSY